MAEGAVADVVEEAGQAQRLHDQGLRRRLGVQVAERRVEVARPLAGQVHGTHGVLEARVLGGGEDPPGALQLVDAAEALQPGMVDHVLLGRSAGHAARLGDPDVAVDRVAREVDSAVLGDGLGHRPAPIVGAGE